MLELHKHEELFYRDLHIHNHNMQHDTCSWLIDACDQYIDGLVQDCSNSSVLAMELLSCTEKSILYRHESKLFKEIL